VLLSAARVYAAAGGPPDPGWILSTCAAAAATLLAIVGGFLVAQLIALVSDQHVADARLADARAAEDEAQGTLAAATDALGAAVTQLLLSNQDLAALVAVRGTVEPAEAERSTDGSALLAELPSELRAQSMGRAVSQLTEIRKRAAHALISIVPATEHQESWERFKWAHFRIHATEDALWRALYQIVAAQRQTDAAELAGRTPPRPVGSTSTDGTLGDSSAGSSPATATATAAAHAPEALAAWRQAVHAADQTSATAKLALQRRKELIPVTEFRNGVGVLAYLAAAVVFPLVVLATGPSTLSVLSRIVVPASLALGVALLIAFFISLSHRTSSPTVSLLSSKQAALPELAALPAKTGNAGRQPVGAGPAVVDQ
jgi:hypothetical protein